MAIKKSSSGGVIESHPKKTRQGMGKNTKYASSPSNKSRKKYRGQGKWTKFNMISKVGMTHFFNEINNFLPE